MTTWDKQSYAKNVKVLAFYPGVGSPFHAWNNIADFEGRRYLYVHDRDYLRILDVTDPAKGKIVYSKGGVWGRRVRAKSTIRPTRRTIWAAPPSPGAKAGQARAGCVIRDRPLRLAERKAGAARQGRRATQVQLAQGIQGLCHGRPLPSQWRLLATRTTDYQHPDAPIGQQRGSGSLDSPEYYGGKYMILSAAPDDSYGLTEYPNYLYSPGYQVWDMTDPADPKFVSQIAVPGQILGDKEHEETYLMNPRAGNRTSWMGARNPIFLPQSLESGGKLGFGAMGGLGVRIRPVRPGQAKMLSGVNTPPSFAGTEFDNADVSQYARTGYVFANGYPMNRDCYEPYKDIFVIDARDPRT